MYIEFQTFWLIRLSKSIKNPDSDSYYLILLMSITYHEQKQKDEKKYEELKESLNILIDSKIV